MYFIMIDETSMMLVASLQISISVLNQCYIVVISSAGISRVIVGKFQQIPHVKVKTMFLPVIKLTAMALALLC